ELADFAIGVGRRRQLLLNEEGADTSRREWLRLIAHEMTHVCQIELAEGEGRAAQWLAEGMAEWVAFTVLERLRLDTMPNRREVARRGIRNHAALISARLDLATLGTPRGFTVRHLREGSVPTYQLAFLMTDYLLEHHGFGRSASWSKNACTSAPIRAGSSRMGPMRARRSSSARAASSFEAPVVVATPDTIAPRLKSPKPGTRLVTTAPTPLMRTATITT